MSREWVGWFPRPEVERPENTQQPEATREQAPKLDLFMSPNQREKREPAHLPGSGLIRAESPNGIGFRAPDPDRYTNRLSPSSPKDRSGPDRIGFQPPKLLKHNENWGGLIHGRAVEGKANARERTDQ